MTKNDVTEDATTTRSSDLDKLTSKQHDVLVIGGGVVGASAALALQARGFSVALVERNDFASSTSQESSNLIWGGFKYLQGYELALVNSLCKSRNQLAEAYPSSIFPVGFLATLDRSAPYRPTFAGLGTLAYWALGRFKTPRPRLYNAKKVAEAEPVVNTETARGAIEYFDYYLSENDARMVFGFIRQAQDLGTAALNYVEFLSAARDGKGWNVDVRDNISGEHSTVRANVILNAAGPYVNQILDVLTLPADHRVVYAKGIHLVVPKLTESERVLAFFDDSQRLFYVIPMAGRSVIGTTDDRVDLPVNRVEPEERQYVLDQINARLSLEKPLTEADVISERAGVRPLVVANDGDDRKEVDWTKLSRKHEVGLNTDKKAITIFGGKITDCINTGDEICELVESLGVEPQGEKIEPWYGEPPASVKARFLQQAQELGVNDGPQPPGFLSNAERIWGRYDLRSFAILEKIRADAVKGAQLDGISGYLVAEIEVMAATESILTMEDFLRRRTHIGLIYRREVLQECKGIAEAAALLFGSRASEKLADYFEGEQVPGSPSSVAHAS